MIRLYGIYFDWIGGDIATGEYLCGVQIAATKKGWKERQRSHVADAAPGRIVSNSRFKAE